MGVINEDGVVGVVSNVSEKICGGDSRFESPHSYQRKIYEE